MFFCVIFVFMLTFVGIPIAVLSAYERLVERDGSVAGYLLLSIDSLVIMGLGGLCGLATFAYFRMFSSRVVATLTDRGVTARYFLIHSEAAWDEVTKVTPIGGGGYPQAVMFVLKNPEQRPWWRRNVIVLAGMLSNTATSDILDYVSLVRPEFVTDTIALNNFPWWKQKKP